MTPRRRLRDDAVMGLFTLVLLLVELVWLGAIAYLILRLMRAYLPSLSG